MPDNSTGDGTARVSVMTVFSLPVIVAALGYFVNIYDLALFSIVRVPSLKGIGISGPELINKGVMLLNMQMIVMLLLRVMSDPAAPSTKVTARVLMASLAAAET